MAKIVVETGSGAVSACSVAVDQVTTIEVSIHDVLFRDAEAIGSEILHRIVDQAGGMRVDLQAQPVFFYRNAEAEIGQIKCIIHKAFTTFGGVFGKAKHHACCQQGAVGSVVQRGIAKAGIVAEVIRQTGVSHAQPVDVVSIIANRHPAKREDGIAAPDSAASHHRNQGQKNQSIHLFSFIEILLFKGRSFFSFALTCLSFGSGFGQRLHRLSGYPEKFVGVIKSVLRHFNRRDLLDLGYLFRYQMQK